MCGLKKYRFFCMWRVLHRSAVALSHGVLTQRPTLAKQFLSRTFSVIVAKGKDTVMNHTLALKASAWQWHPSLLLTFHWPKQVTWWSWTPTRPRSQFYHICLRRESEIPGAWYQWHPSLITTNPSHSLSNISRFIVNSHMNKSIHQNLLKLFFLF